MGGVRGEVPQYYVENSHPAIVSPETFDLVQSEIRRRKASGQRAGASPFIGKIFCGECKAAGRLGTYGPKIWYSNKTYRKEFWQCNGKYGENGGGNYCKTPNLSEEAIKKAFVDAYNNLLADKKRYMAEYAATIRGLSDTSALDEQIADLSAECKKLADQAQKDIRQNASAAQDQEEYKKRHDKLIEQINAVKEKLDALIAEKQDNLFRKERLCAFIDILRTAPKSLTAFDEHLWRTTVESITGSNVFREHKFRQSTVCKIFKKKSNEAYYDDIFNSNSSFAVEFEPLIHKGLLI